VSYRQNSEVQKQEAATIADFGAQWTRYQGNVGYYSSRTLFEDIVGPLLPVQELKNARVAEIGSGTGRIVNMLLDCGVASVVAVEPSDAYDVLLTNTAARGEKIKYLHTTGENIPADSNLDAIFSIGVIHHIPDPKPCLAAMREALKPGGTCLLWLYGKEGNGIYLALSGLLRKFTTRMPDSVLSSLAVVLDLMLQPYIFLARRLPLPMKEYFVGHYGKLPLEARRITVFDQLNPSYAKYYRREEAESLMKEMGFENVKLFHRHGYSWTVRGERPN